MEANIPNEELKFWLLSYENLLYYLKKTKLHKSIFTKINVNFKNEYFIISVKKSNYHVSVFKDQWDLYHLFSKKKQKLFHITKDEPKCSIYFTIDDDMKIKQPDNFRYNQEKYNFFASTRNKCDDVVLKKIVDQFEIILNAIGEKLYRKFMERNKL